MRKPSSGCLSVLPTGRLPRAQRALACGSNKWMSCPQIGRQSHNVLNSYRHYEPPRQKERDAKKQTKLACAPGRPSQNQTRSAATRIDVSPCSSLLLGCTRSLLARGLSLSRRGRDSRKSSPRREMLLNQTSARCLESQAYP